MLKAVFQTYRQVIAGESYQVNSVNSPAIFLNAHLTQQQRREIVFR